MSHAAAAQVDDANFGNKRGKGGGHGRIDGIASLFEHSSASRRCLRAARSDYTSHKGSFTFKRDFSLSREQVYQNESKKQMYFAATGVITKASIQNRDEN